MSEIVEHIEDLSTDTAANIKRANEFQAENKELRKKLEVVIHKNLVLASDLEATRGEMDTMTNAENANLRAELNAARVENGKMKTTCVRRENELQDLLDVKSGEVQELSNRLHELFATIGGMFSVNICDCASLVATLCDVRREADRKCCDLERDDPGYELKRAKRKFRKRLVRASEAFEAELAAMKNEAEQKQDDLTRQIFLLRQTGERQGRRIEELVCETRDCDAAKAGLRAEIDALRTVPKRESDEPEVSVKEFAKCKTECERLTKKNGSLQRQVAAESARIGQLESEKVAMRIRADGYEHEIGDLKRDLAEADGERLRIAGKEKSAEQDAESLRVRVLSLTQELKTRDGALERQNRQMEGLKSALGQAERLVSQQAKEIQNAQGERKKLVALLHAQNAAQAKIELILARHRQRPVPEMETVPQKRETKEDVIPLSSFCCELVPRDVSNRIEDIIGNSGCDNSTRVKRIVTLICQHFHEQIAIMQTQIRDQQFAERKYRDECSRFIDDMHSIFPYIDFDLSRGDPSKQISAELEKLRFETRGVIERLEDADSSKTELLLALDVDNVEQGKARWEDAKREIRYLKQKYEERKRVGKEAKQCYHKVIRALQRNLKEAEAFVAEAEAKSVGNLEKATQVVPSQTDAEDPAVTIARLQAALDMARNQLNDETHLRRAAEADLAERQSEEAKAREMSATLRNKNDEKTAQIKALASRLRKSAEAHRRELRGQRREIAQQYDDTVELMKVRNADLTGVMSHLTGTISNLEEAKGSLESQNTDISVELRKCHAELRSLQYELEREQQIIMSQAKVNSLASEKRLQKRIQELKAALQAAKRDVMNTVATKFHSDVDLAERLTDETFALFIDKIRSQFDCLWKTDRNVRKLLALGPTQSIEDKLSSLLTGTVQCR